MTDNRRVELSDEDEFREAKGSDESDAPTLEEIKERMKTW